MTLFCYIGLILFITFLLFCCPIQYVLPIPIKAPKYLFVIIFLVNKQKKWFNGYLINILKNIQIWNVYLHEKLHKL